MSNDGPVPRPCWRSLDMAEISHVASDTVSERDCEPKIGQTVRSSETHPGGAAEILQMFPAKATFGHAPSPGL